MFETNEGNLDKNIRLIVGVLALLLGIFIFTGVWQIIFIIIGFISVFTGLTGFCLIYKIFGIKTNK